MTRIAMKLAGAVAALLGAGSAMAQIPVTDVAHIALDEANNAAQTGLITANQAANIAKYAQQIVELQNQLTQAKQSYDSMTGSRNLGTILNDPKYRDYLPSDWQKTYDSMRTGGYQGLTGAGQQVYDQNKIYDACQSFEDTDQQNACEASAVKPSQDKANADAAFDAAQSRLDQINQLASQINQTSDPKAIAELQGRIAVEQAAIQNEQTKMQLYQMASQAEDRVQEQRENEINARTWAARDGVSAQPVTFSN